MIKKYAVSIDENYDSDSTAWFNTYEEAEAFAVLEAEKAKATVFIAEFIDGCKNNNYEDDEIEWKGYGYDTNGKLKELKNYICLVSNTRTRETYYSECVYSSVEELKAYYNAPEILPNLKLLRAWEANEVEL